MSVNRHHYLCSSICLRKLFFFVFHLTLEKVLTDQQDSGLLYSMYAVILNLHSWARILLASLFACLLKWHF